MNHASDLSEEIVRFSERVRLPVECAHGDPELQWQDKVLTAEVLWLRSYLLLDMADVSVAAAYTRALKSVKEIDAKAYFSDVKEIRAWCTSPDFRSQLLQDSTEAFKQLRRIVTYKWLVTSIPYLWDPSSPLISYKNIIQWVSFDTKLNMVSASYATSLIEEYIADEAEMDDWEYDSELIHDLHSIASEWLADFPFDSTLHGKLPSGATLGLKRSENCPVTALATIWVSDQVEEYFELMYPFEDNPLPFFNPRRAKPEAMKIAFVPKSPLTNRMISIDSPEMLYIQSDLDWRLRKFLRSIPAHIDLSDQERSRRMALRGSRFGEFDTIDITKASDSVTRKLVHGIVGETWLWRAIDLCCTKYAEYRPKHGRGTVIRLAKLAPMGSSICFSIETFVFVTAAELAVRRTLGRRAKPDDFTVYGDDCAIRHDCVEEFLRILASLHLKVSEGKTFTDSEALCFREACGIEACNGQDISPVRVSRGYCGAIVPTSGSLENGRVRGVVGRWPKSPEQICSLVDFCNRLLLQGLTQTRKALVSLIRKEKWFYRIYRLDQLDYQRSVDLWASGVKGYNFPVPTFIVPDGTATNYRAKSGRSFYAGGNKGGVPRGIECLCVKARHPKEEDIVSILNRDCSSATADEWAYHYWLLKKESCSERRSEADSVGLVERLCYFGSGPSKWDWVTVAF